MFDRIIFAVVLMVGAFPAAGIMVASTIGEYEYFLPYRYAGVAFLFFSPLAGFFMHPLWQRITKLDSPALQIVLTAMFAYGVTWACLAMMNFTSLCIGLENGDGENSTAHCMVGTILNGIVFAVFAFLGNLPGAAIYGYLKKRRG